MACWILLFGLLVAVSLSDLRTGRIPDALNGAIALTGLAGTAWVSGLESALLASAAQATMLGLTMFAASMAERRYGRRFIGGGDLKLLAALGFWVAMPDLWLAITLASVAGLAWLLAASLATGRARNSLRFGPFIALGVIVIVTWQHLNIAV